MAKEAKARIKINKLLEEAGWQLLDTKEKKANVLFENNVKITRESNDALGDNFESVSNGFIDFLLLDKNGYPLVVLEAKSNDKNPLSGKEQARKYARNINCRFIILSNGDLHYFWDIEYSNPTIITAFPTPESFERYKEFKPNKQRLIDEPCNNDYIALTQDPNYKTNPEYVDLNRRQEYFDRTSIRILRDYQLNALKSIQRAVKEGSVRFLFEIVSHAHQRSWFV